MQKENRSSINWLFVKFTETDCVQEFYGELDSLKIILYYYSRNSMKQFFTYIAVSLLLMGAQASAQSVSYYDLTFQADSVRSPFQSTTKNYVFVRSKRGVDGVNTTPSADSIRNLPISKIVLVFTEDSPEDLENREEYNQERWDNLIMTYPEYL